MGATHATMGAAAATATLPLVAPWGVTGSLITAAGWVGAWGAAALLPDLDDPADRGRSWRNRHRLYGGSEAAQMWGPLSRGVARVVKVVSGGHRKGTHDLVLGPPAMAALAALALLHPWASGLLVAALVGMFLRAFERVIPGEWEGLWPVNLLASALAGAASVLLGYAPAWLPLAVAGGAVVHILGDLVTIQGVPAPGGTFTGARWRVLLPMRTGGALEAVVDGALWLAIIAGLIYWTGALA